MWFPSNLQLCTFALWRPRKENLIWTVKSRIFLMCLSFTFFQLIWMLNAMDGGDFQISRPLLSDSRLLWILWAVCESFCLLSHNIFWKHISLCQHFEWMYIVLRNNLFCSKFLVPHMVKFNFQTAADFFSCFKFIASLLDRFGFP